MTKSALTQHIFEKGSYLCVGLDTDPEKIPDCLRKEKDPVLTFNKAIIDATEDLCVAYKLNTAFYECMGMEGWKILKDTVDYISDNHFVIADAKRGDIGNTSLQYAKTFFQTYQFDALTVAPYMGSDSVAPFLTYPDKWAIVLGLTSNKGSLDFQMEQAADGSFFYEKVIKKVAKWGSPDNLMFVIGATREEQIAEIRQWVPDHFFLVPGVGAQGGNLQKISALGLNTNGGLLINASRSVIYAGKDIDFADRARSVADNYRQEMQAYLKEYCSQELL